MKIYTLGDIQHWTLDAFNALVDGQAELKLSPHLAERLKPAQDLINQQADQRQLIYGLTTGFGPLGGQFLPLAERARVQRNLVYHLATGVGPALAPDRARAVLLARMITLAQGYSAVSHETLSLMYRWWQAGLVPYIPSLGSVGASGDLTPLAHLALALMGEGEVMVDGRRTPAGPILEQHGIPPANLHDRDALALVNGTDTMAALSARNAHLMNTAFSLCLDLGLMFSEVLEGDLDAWRPEFGDLRPHPGQQHVHAYLYQKGQESNRLRCVSTKPRFEAPEELSGGHEPLQEPYTTRCLPQLYGAVHDVMTYHNQTVTTELNSVSDNPIIHAESGHILHGGNFFGQHISFAADALNNAVVMVAVHLDRKINRICHPKLNRGFPAFLQPKDTGVNSGLMGAQVTATSLVAELRGAGSPLSSASIATNGDNQDVVTMGTLASNRLGRQLELLYKLIAIDAIACAQAYDLCTEAEQADFSPVAKQLHQRIRSITPMLDEDRPLYSDIEKLAAHFTL